MSHHFRSKPETEINKYRQTKSAPNAGEVEESQDIDVINEYMPSYITKKPFYFVGDKESLDHHRAKPKDFNPDLEPAKQKYFKP
jgi:hypothetical protein